jgi:hypothetical protein
LGERFAAATFLAHAHERRHRERDVHAARADAVERPRRNQVGVVGCGFRSSRPRVEPERAQGMTNVPYPAHD